MIVFNLWGALFVLVAFVVGAGLEPLSRQMGLGPIAGGVVGTVADLALRAHKRIGPWNGGRFGDVAGDLFDPALGGMVLVLPIWLWGLAATVFGLLHYTNVL
jgi:hypothetical protein